MEDKSTPNLMRDIKTFTLITLSFDVYPSLVLHDRYSSVIFNELTCIYCSIIFETFSCENLWPFIDFFDILV